MIEVAVAEISQLGELPGRRGVELCKWAQCIIEIRHDYVESLVSVVLSLTQPVNSHKHCALDW